MKLPTKVRYGLRAMVDLASHEGNKPVFLNSIAGSQGISRSYLDALFARLRSAELVRSVRGAAGGYCLKKAPENIKVLDIVLALDGRPVLVDCLEDGFCDRTSTCATREVWERVREAIESTLSAVTLKDLVLRMNEKKMEGSVMYYI